jgi:hypothetical protein
VMLRTNVAQVSNALTQNFMSLSAFRPTSEGGNSSHMLAGIDTHGACAELCDQERRS